MSIVKNQLINYEELHQYFWNKRDPRNDELLISMTELADQLGVSLSAVSYGMQKMRLQGFVEKLNKGNPERGRGCINFFRINPPKGKQEKEKKLVESRTSTWE